MTLDEAFRLARTLIMVALFPAGVVTGCWERGVRAQAFEDRVEENGKRALAARVQRILDQGRINKEVVDGLHARITSLTRSDDQLFDELLNDSAGGIVPPAGPVAGGAEGPGDAGADPDRACFSRGQLVAGVRVALQGFVEGLEPGLQRGDAALLFTEAAITWDERQGAVGK